MKKFCSKCNALHDHDSNCTVGRYDRNYKHKEAYRLRNNRRWHAVRDQALERDNHLCVACRYLDNYLNSYRLEVHHIRKVEDYPELVYVLKNTLTLCQHHHKLADKSGLDLTPVLVQLPWYTTTEEYPPTL